MNPNESEGIDWLFIAFTLIFGVGGSILIIISMILDYIGGR